MPPSENGHTISNNSSATAAELFECVGPFSGVGAERVRNFQILSKYNISKASDRFLEKHVDPKLI